MPVFINNENIIKAASIIPKGQPVCMVNLVKYRENALYSPEYAGQFEPCSGKEAYHNRYIPAFNKVAANTEGIKIVFMGGAHDCGLFVGPEGEKWDAVAVVEYPSIDAFEKIALGDDYKKYASAHVLAALEDWRLIPTAKLM